MRYSQLFGKTSKNITADAESRNAELLTQGGFISKQMAGVYNYLPLGLRVLTKIQNIIREELDRVGAQEILMPALTQEESYVTTGRNTMDVLFHTLGQGESKLVLNPTHEEIVTPLVKSHTFSYRDLPLAVYQIQNKFRNEPRAKSGLLRGREFNMKDLYSFHTIESESKSSLENYYEEMKDVYFKIYERLGFGDRVVLTYASGGDFSDFSHEFQAISPIGEDTIFLCEKCGNATNKEIIANSHLCLSGCGNLVENFKEVRAVEVGNIFKLYARFSDAFAFTYNDKDGKEQKVQMGCYGIGPSRIMGTIVELFNDPKGIIWPENIAPFQVHLVSLNSEDLEIKQAAEDLYNQLKDSGIEVIIDDRSNVSPGEKFADADLIGIPYRLVVSKKTWQNKNVEMKKRNSSNSEAKFVPQEDIIQTLIDELKVRK